MRQKPDLKYRHGESTHEATTPEGIVVQMRLSARMDRTPTIQRYMQAVSKRAEEQTGKTIRTDSCTHFLEDLVGAGLMEKV